MNYQLNVKKLWVPLDRVALADIAINDTIRIDGLSGAEYVWQEQDASLVENNPDDDLFLEVKKASGNQYEAIGLILREVAPS